MALSCLKICSSPNMEPSIWFMTRKMVILRLVPGEAVSFILIVNFCPGATFLSVRIVHSGSKRSLQSGDAATALKYVNRIRTRAQLPALSSVDLETIKTEKRLELCGEGQRFQDLLRWGDAEARLKDMGNTYPKMDPNGAVTYVPTGRSVYGFKKGKHEHLPYPFTETMLNENVIQNPGY